MPAEWEPHKACWMAWPCRSDLWPDIKKAREAYAQVALAIAQFEPVVMVSTPKDMADCRATVGQDVNCVSWPLNDSWTRDFGPTFIFDEDQALAAVAWQFNGWGNRFTPYDDDQLFAQRVADYLGCSLNTADLVCEGGAIHTNGAGTFITTRQCLLNPNRNPSMTDDKIKMQLAKWLGCRKLIWLEQGLVDDHTDGHIDELACFFDTDKILCLDTDDMDDANYPILKSNIEKLSSETTAQGEPLKVTKIQQPEARYLSDGSRMSLSYINFYIANGGVVMPAFNQPEKDRAAKHIVAQCFPDREIVQVPALAIFEGGGGIHCITQQQPFTQ